eukprot:365139-Chlamydomonas_euryale.AAC.9
MSRRRLRSLGRHPAARYWGTAPRRNRCRRRSRCCQLPLLRRRRFARPRHSSAAWHARLTPRHASGTRCARQHCRRCRRLPQARNRSAHQRGRGACAARPRRLARLARTPQPRCPAAVRRRRPHRRRRRRGCGMLPASAVATQAPASARAPASWHRRPAGGTLSSRPAGPAGRSRAAHSTPGSGKPRPATPRSQLRGRRYPARTAAPRRGLAAAAAADPPDGTESSPKTISHRRGSGRPRGHLARHGPHLGAAGARRRWRPPP